MSIQSEVTPPNSNINIYHNQPFGFSLWKKAYLIENLLFIRFIASIMLCRTALCCRRDKTLTGFKLTLSGFLLLTTSSSSLIAFHITQIPGYLNGLLTIPHGRRPRTARF